MGYIPTSDGRMMDSATGRVVAPQPIAPSAAPKPVNNPSKEGQSTMAPTLNPDGSTSWVNNPTGGGYNPAPPPPPPTSDYSSQIAGLNASIQSGLAQLAQAYPSYPNAAGLGTQNPTGYQPQPENTSRGFNPWSLVGEANSRG